MTEIVEMKRPRPAGLPVKLEPSFREFDEFARHAEHLGEIDKSLRKAGIEIRRVAKISVPAALQLATKALDRGLPIGLVTECKDYLRRYAIDWDELDVSCEEDDRQSARASPTCRDHKESCSSVRKLYQCREYP